MLLELYPTVHRRYASLPIIGPTLDGMRLQHLVFYGTKVDGTPFTSRRYFRL